MQHLWQTMKQICHYPEPFPRPDARTKKAKKRKPGRKETQLSRIWNSSQAAKFFIFRLKIHILSLKMHILNLKIYILNLRMKKLHG